MARSSRRHRIRAGTISGACSRCSCVSGPAGVVSRWSRGAGLRSDTVGLSATLSSPDCGRSMVTESACEDSSVIRRALLPVLIHFPIDHVRNVAPLAEELHHFLAGACHLRPAGFRIGVLLEPPNLVSVMHEIDLPQAALGSAPNGVTLSTKHDNLSVLDEGLPPDFD